MHAREKIPYRVADAPWPANLGSHRAIVRVETAGDAALAHVLWRRRDLNPERKDIIVLDRATKQTVRNRAALRITQESGDIVFQPISGPGEYEIYYLPFERTEHWGMNAGRYKLPEATAEPDWLQTIQNPPRAGVAQIEARTPFDHVTVMGLPATAEETAHLLKPYADVPYLLFPTPRELPIRMADRLALSWLETGPSNEFRGEAFRNEYFAFQVGVFAAQQKLEALAVEFQDLNHRAADAKIPASALHCFNLGGIDRHGKPFQKTVSVDGGNVQALWFGVDIPAEVEPGEYSGKLTIRPANAPGQNLNFVLTVKPDILPDRGDSEPWRHSRLRWLDSTIALDDEVAPPFTPVKVSGRTVRILDRALTYGANALPVQIESRRQPILHSPVRFVIAKNGRTIEFKRGDARTVAKMAARSRWESTSAQDDFTLACRATMEFDGFVSYELSLRAERETLVEDIYLEIPFRRDIATYMMGMCLRGARRPAYYEWRWDWSRNQDDVWIGDVHAGLRIQLRDDTYQQPLVGKYLQKPLRMPPSWNNGGRGGCLIRDVSDDCVLFTANSGPRKMAAGEQLRFDFTLLITPFKRLDTAKHFRTRHFHSEAPIEKAVEQGLNSVTIHHATSLYPFINCPFLTADRLRAHADEAHRHGLKMRVYYTVRELTNHVPELWALRSLGDEIFIKGDGGGDAWLQENLVKDYSPNWYHPFANGDVCAAITETAASRWHNYWLEGLRWLAENVGIDGIYIDDTNLDRVGMQRARKILERHRPGSIIDLHANDMYWGMYGLGHTTNLHMELFPCLDSTWFGESYDYTRTSPAYWLLEMSGIPFGLMGENLFCELPPNPGRAALYGMHLRPPVPAELDPVPIFEVWDEFGIADAKMIGYWEKHCPVRTNHDDVLATAYVRKGKTLIAVASWADKPTEVRFKFDWKTLGLNARKSVLRAPRIERFQKSALFRPRDPIPIEPQRGWIMLLE